MSRRKTILISMSMFILSSVVGYAGYAQTKLSAEEKKELRKFDPADIVPEARGSESLVERGPQEREKTRFKQKARGVDAARSAAMSIPVEAPGITPTPLLQSESPGKPVPGPSLMPMAPGSNNTAGGTIVSKNALKRSSRWIRLPLPVSLVLIGVTLSALVFVGNKLLKELQASEN